MVAAAVGCGPQGENFHCDCWQTRRSECCYCDNFRGADDGDDDDPCDLERAAALSAARDAVVEAAIAETEDKYDAEHYLASRRIRRDAVAAYCLLLDGEGA